MDDEAPSRNLAIVTEMRMMPKGMNTRLTSWETGK